ncbi:MAG: fumarylacetoacetate hydrolase family protein [Chloroflexota bacterium]
MEVWAAGVTYQRSRAARVEESAVRDIYDRVYDDPRPELFFKSVPWRVVTDGEAIAVRGDSQLNVPEAELAVMVNAYAEIVGYLVCNDVSSRSIEGQNPLYLPQAKLYAGSCALGTMVRPAWELGAGALAISVSVSRMGSEVWSGTASTGEMHRPLEELVSWLFREEQYPDGVILSTGTGVVPGLDFTLKAGDCVTVNIESVGSLMNNVVEGKGSFTWLASAGRGRTGGV